MQSKTAPLVKILPLLTGDTLFDVKLGEAVMSLLLFEFVCSLVMACFNAI
jgi:hypothetical protein